MKTKKYNTIENFNHLVESGDIVQCPNCGEYNAYAWQDVNMQDGRRLINGDGFKDGGELYTDDEILTKFPNVYHIPSCSSYEWTCGCCKLSWTPVDSPLTAEVYTHIPTIERDEE